MSTAAIIAIVIGAVVVLAAVSFFTLARRSDVRGAGALSGETLTRDKPSARTRAPSKPPPPPARRVRPQWPKPQGTASRGYRHRTRQGRGRAGTRAVGRSRPRGHRRLTPPVLQPRHRHTDDRRPGHVRCGSVRRLPLADRYGRLRRHASPLGKLGDIKAGINQGGGFFYVPEARSWITEYPSEALPLAATIYPENVLSRQWSRASSSSARSARTSAVVSRSVPPASGSSASATVRSTTVSVRRRPVRLRVAWTATPLTITPGGDVVINTGIVVPGPAIGVNTTGQEAEGPHCTSGGEH